MICVKMQLLVIDIVEFTSFRTNSECTFPEYGADPNTRVYGLAPLDVAAHDKFYEVADYF